MQNKCYGVVFAHKRWYTLANPDGGSAIPGARPQACRADESVKTMSIYQKNLKRLGLALILISIADTVLVLSFYKYLIKSSLLFSIRLQSPAGICLKNALGLTIGSLACYLYYRSRSYRWIARLLSLLIVAEPIVTLSFMKGSVVTRVDGLINATLIVSAMVVYTALQLERSERNWDRISSAKPAVLDLKLSNVRQWFNPIEIGPKLELSSEISSVVDRFLSTAKEARPLSITVCCPSEVSEPMRATMQEVFQMYYEDEEQHVNSYLERRYIRVMALVIISIIAVSVWIDFYPAADEGVTWTSLSNFAAFSLWQIGSTHFERSEGYAELLRASIAKQAKLSFWAE